MKFLLISEDESNAFLLDKLQAEEHETRWLAKSAHPEAWSGILTKSLGLQEAIEWRPDITIVDGVGFGPVVKQMQAADLRVFGGGRIQDRLSEDWLYSMGLLDTLKIPTHGVEKFTSVADAAEYIHAKEQPWYYRGPDGNGFGTDTTQGMQEMLEEMYQNGNVPAVFTLQRGFPSYHGSKIRLHPEFYIAGMFNERGLMDPVLQIQAAYNLLPDRQGIDTCEGVTVTSLKIDDPDVQATLRKCEPMFKTMQYRGWAFMGVVYGEREEGNSYGPIVTDFFLTPPPGFWACFVGGLKMKLGLFLDRAVNPNRPNTPFDFWNGVVSSRLLSVPPYPMTEAPWISEEMKQTLLQQTPPVRIAYADWGVFWNSIRQNGSPSTAELTGPKVGWIVGRGPRCGYEESLRQIRNTAEGLPIPFKQCKTDPDPVYEFNASPHYGGRLRMLEVND